MEYSEDVYAARHEQAARTKNRIFTAATELFNEKGFDNVTIRDICKRAGVANGTFYLHYRSKHDILYFVYKKADELFEQEHFSVRKDLTVWQKLLELIRMQLSMANIFHVKSDSVKQLYVYQLESDNQYFLSEDREFYTQLYEVVEMGKARGDIRTDIETKVICWRILRFARGIIFDWCLHNCTYPLVEFGTEEMSFYLQSFSVNRG